MRDPRSSQTSRSTDPYRWYAGIYGWWSAPFNWWRRRAVQRLELRPGDVVVDVGCGIGLCFPLIEAGVGRTGLLIGVEPSEAMLQRAQALIDRHGWDNVILVPESAEEAELPRRADAVLFCAVHEVLRSLPALENLFRQVNDGGRVVAVGGKWAPPWLLALNLFVAVAHAPFVASFEGFDRPWSHLQRFVPDLRVTSAACETAYLGWGTVTGAGQRAGNRDSAMEAG
jgi:ubiquinone/menaquinone biosynthesis C-methylase UbiE